MLVSVGCRCPCSSYWSGAWHICVCVCDVGKDDVVRYNSLHYIHTFWVVFLLCTYGTWRGSVLITMVVEVVLALFIATTTVVGCDLSFLRTPHTPPTEYTGTA